MRGLKPRSIDSKNLKNFSAFVNKYNSLAQWSCVRVIACLISSQLLPLLMQVENQLAAMLAAKRSTGVAPDVDLRECTLYLPPQKQIWQNALWL